MRRRQMHPPRRRQTRGVLNSKVAAKRDTSRFWTVLYECVRTLLIELHGEPNAAGDGGWITETTSYDVSRAIVLARRVVIKSGSTYRIPHNFLKCFYDGVTEQTCSRIRRYLQTWGFNARVAGQLAPSTTARRLAMMPTLDWERQRMHGRRAWYTQFKRIYGTLHILDVGAGCKSWSRWLSRCVPAAFANSVVVVTIDCKEELEPDILADITKWRTWLREKLRALGYEGVRFHIVHFAAECTEYSQLKNGLDRDLPYATWLAQCGMQMILELKPLIWFIECAGSGANALKHQPVMQDPCMQRCHVDLTLCHVGTDYRKQSSWWTNVPRVVYAHYGFPESPCCSREGRKCIWELVFGRHPRHVGGSRGGDDPTRGVPREECMMYPELLCAQWIASALHCMLYYPDAMLTAEV